MQEAHQGDPSLTIRMTRLRDFMIAGDLLYQKIIKAFSVISVPSVVGEKFFAGNYVRSFQMKSISLCSLWLMKSLFCLLLKSGFR